MGKEITAEDGVTGTTSGRRRIKAGTGWAGREAGKPLSSFKMGCNRKQ